MFASLGYDFVVMPQELQGELGHPHARAADGRRECGNALDEIEPQMTLHARAGTPVGRSRLTWSRSTTCASSTSVQTYHAWLNDPDVMQFLEARFRDAHARRNPLLCERDKRVEDRSYLAHPLRRTARRQHQAWRASTSGTGAPNLSHPDRRPFRLGAGRWRRRRSAWPRPRVSKTYDLFKIFAGFYARQCR